MFLLACSVLISFLNCLQETHFRSTNSLMNIWLVASCTMCAAVVWSEAGWSGLCQDVTAQTHHGWKLCSCCWLVKLLFCICFTALPYWTVQFVSVMLVKCFTVLHLVLNCFPSAPQWGWLKLTFNSLNTSDVIECSWNKATLNTYTLHCVQCERRVHSGFLAFGILKLRSHELILSSPLCCFIPSRVAQECCTFAQFQWFLSSVTKEQHCRNFSF